MQGIFSAVCWLVKECENQMLMGDDDTKMRDSYVLLEASCGATLTVAIV